MTWSLRYQMLLPLVVFVAMLAFTITFDQAALQVKQESNQAIQVYIDVSRRLSTVTPGQSLSILNEYQREYPDWNFVVIDHRRLKTSTIPLSARKQEILANLPAAPKETAGHDAFLLAAQGNWYYVSPIIVPGWNSGSYLVCLEPYQAIASTITGVYRRSSWMAFSISGILICVAAIYSNRLSHRVFRIQKQVQHIAAGNLSQMADERGHDEISQLAKSVNSMAADLESMKQLVEQTERSRLHAQLAGGIAHELRNGIHTARLSLEMFQEVCDPAVITSQSMLINAQEQLSITETLVRRLLTLGKPQKRTLIPEPLNLVLDNVVETMQPISHHTEVHFRSEIDPQLDWIARDSESMQAAFLNLCMNAVEAAGRHGEVHLTAQPASNGIEIQISDTGSGPAAEISETLFEPFTTTKPEGIGLGLGLVRQAVTEAGGSVGWNRIDNRTVFHVWLPTQAEDNLMSDITLSKSNHDNRK